MYKPALFIAFSVALCEVRGSVPVTDKPAAGPWSNWSPCSTTCGEGKRWRERERTLPDETPNGTMKETKYCFLQFCPSYLSWPRIHFSGTMVADVSTVNNVRCAYDIEFFSGTVLSKHYVRMDETTTTRTYYDPSTSDWNSDGGNQVYLENTYVTSFCNSPNNCSTNESIVGAKVIESTRGVMALLDPDWQKTEIWSLKVNIPGVLKGDFAPASRYVEGVRVDDIVGNVGYAMGYTTRFKSKLQNVTWQDDYYKNLFSNARELSFTFVIDLFNQLTLSGRISGTIGLTSSDDPKQLMATRILQLSRKSSLQRVRPAPFYIHFPQRTLTLDFGFSVKGRQDGSLPTCDLGNLDIVLLLSKKEYCEHFRQNKSCHAVGNETEFTWRWITKGGEVTRKIGKDNSWYMIYGGVMDFDLSHLDARTFQLLKNTRIALIDSDKTVYLEEFPLGITYGLTESYDFRLDKGDSGILTGFVSSFGRPVKNAGFSMHIMKNSLANTVCEQQICNRSLGIPEKALRISTDHHIALTNRSGLVHLEIKALEDPGNPRGCGLDGQVYPMQLFVRYSKTGKSFTFTDYEETLNGLVKPANYATHNVPLSLKLYTYVPEKECPTWSDVRRIFTQYYNLYPVMWKSGIIDLHSYADIRKRAKMLKVAMFDLDINDPRYMPVSRDLSKGKRKLIYNWMKCGMRRSEPATKSESKPNICSEKYIREGVKYVRQLLHKAMMLELSTIPPYINAWLSLKTEFGRNKGIAALVKSIYNEEMLHMSLDGNILNAVGGIVNMTDATKLPVYPTILATGDMFEICPDMEVGLAPFSIGLVADVFSKIEKPSGFRGRQLIHSLAKIWKLLPSRDDDNVATTSMKILIREYKESNLYEPNNLTVIHQAFATGGMNHTSIKSNLESWKKLGDFANEKLSIVLDLNSRTVGEFYSLIALRLTSLESCLQIGNLESMLRGQNATAVPHKTIFTGNVSHQLNISHWYQKSDGSILSVVKSMGGDTSSLDATEVKRDRHASLIRPTLFEVTDLKTALEAIVEIAYQGEGGSECSPFVPETRVYASERGRDNGHQLSHYYRFQEIVHGRKLIAVSNPSDSITCLNISRPDFCPSFAKSGERYCYAGEQITFYEDGVWPILFNPHDGHYEAGTKASLLNYQFNLLYTRLLYCLEKAFGGDPTHTRNCMTLMYDLTIVGKKLVRTPMHVFDNTTKIEFGKTGENGSPTWIFVLEKPYKAGEPVRIARKKIIAPETLT